MKLVWYRPEHYKDEKKKQSFGEALRNSNVLTDRLKEILVARIELLEREEYDPSIYDAGYPFRQAFQSGRKKELTEILDLLDFDKH